METRVPQKGPATATAGAQQHDMLVEGGMSLPWWEFSPADFFPAGSVAQPNSDADEALLRGFLRAGALAETAACFLSANSLKVVGVLEDLSRDELVLPTPEQLGANRYLSQQHGTGRADSGHAVLSCRNRLYGLPLADRHAALNAACSLRHRLPRRALVNFVCRLILGKDVAQLKEDQRRNHHHHHHHAAGGEMNGARGSCACGGRPLAAKTQRGETGTLRSLAPDAVALLTACSSCLARRGWMDSFSARMLSVACRKMLWDRTLPDDEALALNRCLFALLEIMGDPAQETAWLDSSGERSCSHYSGGGGFSSPYGSSPQALGRVFGGASLGRATLASTARSTSQTEPPRGFGASEADASPCHRLPPAAVGVASLLARVRRRQLGANAFAGDHEGGRANAGHRDGGSTHSADKRPRSAADESRTGEAGPPPAKKAATVYPNLARQSESPVRPAKGGRVSVDDEKPAKASTHRPEQSAADNVDMVGSGPVSESAAAAVEPNAAAAAVAVGGESAGPPDRSAMDQPEDCLTSKIREQMKSVVEKLVAAGARGATSADVQGAATATVSLLQAAVSPSALPTRRSSVSFQDQQQQQPLKIVCKELGLDVSRSKGTSGCGDDLVMAVCTGFVTQALSLRNCLAFVEAVLVPRARSLSSPASRLLVSTVSGVGKTRPEVVIEGLIRPLLCEGDQSEVGSAQCELCTRLIKQILPKHTLEAVLVALCGVRQDEGVRAGRWSGDPGGGGDGGNLGLVTGSCVWTELTMPVITAAVNLKPPLSEKAVGVVVRRVEAAAEQPELQKSLKFTTLVHGLVTRYGPQLKPFVPALRTAVGRCTTFMVKAVLAALQRLEK